jgi:hypothetical protein
MRPLEWQLHLALSRRPASSVDVAKEERMIKVYRGSLVVVVSGLLKLP